MGIPFEDGNFSLFVRGFLGTIELSALSALFALLLGFMLAAFRVSPVPVLRGFGTAWVTIFRNTPLTLMFFAVTFVLPRLDVHISSFTAAVAALSIYTGSFVCEVLRAGINTVPLGQAEAARSLGMGFGQTLGLVVLPQAARAVLAPMGSVFIALPRNSAIGGAFNVFELFSVQKTLTEKGYAIFAIFFWVALAYLVISFAVGAVFSALERRTAVAR
ncbi:MULTISPECIES: amino acid ABC transporter permease [Kitasatospora]|uniref:Amino acid ABC transporter membrane protein 1 (PAAT family) n=1 Tax=Kitasatospora cineracea TaxID=88074 RepID=A0A3N4S005_9ACTN|nr:MULTISPECIES: amino acid ABC transporter permease [Kitasatospora]ROR38601.1 amino acid ABC transporter membrane protein 1 (PAAT family) [Kitasatospora cineracea]RPE32330.1 amino acid ABC transporter membrane protein 1 (PAAT family) [Kitasatospora cineracea]